MTMTTKAEAYTCEVCGAVGVKAARCKFSRGCSCWRGIPCDGGKILAEKSRAQQDQDDESRMFPWIDQDVDGGE
jgi:hypothetical protein